MDDVSAGDNGGDAFPVQTAPAVAAREVGVVDSEVPWLERVEVVVLLESVRDGRRGARWDSRLGRVHLLVITTLPNLHPRLSGRTTLHE